MDSAIDAQGLFEVKESRGVQTPSRGAAGWSVIVCCHNTQAHSANTGAGNRGRLSTDTKKMNLFMAEIPCLPSS